MVKYSIELKQRVIQDYGSVAKFSDKSILV